MAQGGGRSWESLRTLGAQGSHPIRNVDAAPRAYRSTPSGEVLFVLEVRLRASRNLVSDALLVASNPDDKPLLFIAIGVSHFPPPEGLKQHDVAPEPIGPRR